MGVIVQVRLAQHLHDPLVEIATRCATYHGHVLEHFEWCHKVEKRAGLRTIADVALLNLYIDQKESIYTVYVNHDAPFSDYPHC